MPKLLQINVVANSGSTGKIAEQIDLLAKAEGWDCYMAYGRWAYNSSLNLYKIGSKIDIYWHGIESLLFDRHALSSRKATNTLIGEIKRINPDIIHLHNIHGYYLNLPILCSFLAEIKKPVVMTLHDCWTVTGHCVHFQDVDCTKWIQGCHDCPNLKGYPKSLFVDNSKNNWSIKKESFALIKDYLTIVPVCSWLRNIVSQSYLKDADCRVIINGIDLDVFQPQTNAQEIRNKYGFGEKFVLLFVANVWNSTKGWEDVLWLRNQISDEAVFVMVGLSPKQKKNLPEGIVGFCHTENVNELVDLYSIADVFVNPTYQDTLPTVSIEALACGTPVVSYDTGGSSDIVDEKVGALIKRGDKEGLLNSIIELRKRGKTAYKEACRAKAMESFNNKECFKKYLELYKELL